MNKKFTLMVFSMLMATVSALAAIGQKDTVIIYQPGPGLNDATDDGSINAGKDTWADQFNQVNNAATPYTIVRPISNCNFTHAVGYIRFDLGTLPDTVDSVFVGFTHYDHTNYCYSGCSADFFFTHVESEWYEDSVDYAYQPTVDTTKYFYGPVHIEFPNSRGTVEYNITDMYRKWRDSTITNYGMVIFSNTVACNNASAAFMYHTSDDTDATKRPYLKIHYKIDTGTIDTSTNVATAYDLSNNVKAYPNPTSGDITLSVTLPKDDYGWFAVTDLAGKILLKENAYWQAGENEIEVPTGSLSPGVYIYTVQTLQGRYTGKIMKR